MRSHSQKKKGLNNYVMRSYCLSTRISTARPGQISFTFGTGEVKIWLKQGKGIGHFKRNHNFCFCRRHKNTKKALASNEVILGSLDSQEVQILSECATMLRYIYAAYLILLMCILNPASQTREEHKLRPFSIEVLWKKFESQSVDK